MIKAYLRTEDTIKAINVDLDSLETIDTSALVWLDMVSPTPEESIAVERSLKLELPTRQESEEIEYSSRYWEDENGIWINTSFLVKEDEKIKSETVSFILKDGYLTVIRFEELRIFTEFSRKLRLTPRAFHNGADVLSGILAMRVDIDADMVEHLSKEIVTTGRKDPDSFASPSEYLEYITTYEDINITFRENLTDKHRVLSSLLKSSMIPDGQKRELSMMIKDVNSLVISANFNFDRLDYLQNLFLNHMSMEQNKVIKIFTVMSVIFLPPTLIASIYGMNFRFLPELNWHFGYPVALILIALSAVLPLYIFKKKGWL
jgi:magnesium transporter